MTTRILVTGAAGFIGSHVAHDLSMSGYHVTCVDNMARVQTLNPVDVLKGTRLRRLANNAYSLYDNCDLTNRSDVERVFSYANFDIVVHLAAETGVRESMKFPNHYAQANMLAFSNVIEFANRHNVRNFIYASSSSVYGDDAELPMREDADVNHPKSFYAATKRSNELMAYSYSQQGLNTTGLRFFTVYGSHGRLNMAPYQFTDAILNDRTIQLFNKGENTRDFTHVSHVTHVIKKLIARELSMNTWIGNIPNPYRIFNVGSGDPITTLQFVNELEAVIGKPAKLELVERQAGDVDHTYACVNKLQINGLMPMSKPRVQHLRELVNWVKLFQTINKPVIPGTKLVI